MKKAALITGASSGIGKASALTFAKNGYFVYLMGRDKGRLEETASLCPAGASILSCDLKDPVAVKKRLEEVLHHKLYKLEILVNNAGIYQRHSVEEGSDELWREQFEVNVLAPVRLARALFPYFKAQGGGSIVNVSSTLGLSPVSNTSSYSAMKAALNNFTQTLALEGGAHNIRVNAVCPGIIDTPMHAFHSMATEDKKTALEQLKGLQPLGRFGTVEDIAKAIYFLGSDQSSWTTGSLLSVDGGVNIA